MNIVTVVCQNEKCRHKFKIRRPKLSVLSKVIPLVLCPKCYPNQSEEVCGGCRLPFSIVPKHSKDLCNTCFQRNWRYEKEEESL